ncbi:MAG: ATP-binding protein [Flammeovirgaceae bacterium]
MFLGLVIQTSFAQHITGLPPIRNISAKEYNSFPQNFGATQHPNGLMYIANTYNIVEYDGVNWRKIPEEGRLLSRSIMSNNSGEIYVGSIKNFGRLQADSTHNFQFVSLAHHIPENLRNYTYVNYIYETQDGIYFIANEIIFQFVNNEFIRAIKPQGQFNGAQIWNDHIYLIDTAQGLVQIVGGQLQALSGSSVLKEAHIFSIFSNANNQLELITSKGSFIQQKLSDGKYTYQLAQRSKLNQTLTAHTVSAVIPLHDGSLAIGTSDAGVIIFKASGQSYQLDKRNGLCNNNVLNLFLSKENLLWAMTGEGLALINYHTPLRFIDDRLGYEGRNYVATTYRNTLYTSGSTGTYKLENDQTFTRIPNTHPAFFLEEIDGKLYTATRKNIALIHPNGSVKQIYNGKAWVIRKLTHYPNKAIAGIDDGLLVFNQTPNGLQFSHKIDGFHDHSRWVHEDDEGNIWVAFQSRHVSKIRLNQEMTEITEQRVYTHQEGLPKQKNYIVYKLKTTDEKHKIVVTTEEGIYEYQADADHFVVDHSFDSINGKGFVHPISQGADGRIYWQKNGEKGILYPTKQGIYTLYKRPFLGLKDQWVEWMHEIDENRVLLSVGTGLVMYDRQLDQQEKQEVELKFRQFFVKESLVYNGATSHQTLGSLQIPYDKNTVRFGFAAQSFQQADQTQYRYQLIGFDETWSAWTTKTEKEYTNLSEGKYTFCVMAKNHFGDESKVISYTFQVLPPWYLTRLAFLVYIALGIGFMWLILWLNSIRMIHQKQKLERIIRAHTEEIRQQKEELEVQSEEIMGQAEHLQMANEQLIKLDKFKQHMTSMIVHDLKNPLGAIISISPEGSRINAEAKQMLTLVSNILDVNKFENTEVQLNLNNYTLCEIGRAAMTQVDLLIAEKQIKLDVQVPQNQWVHADAELMARVMVNLFTNAIKYTPNNGTITLTSSVVNDQWIRFGIHDNGQGIPAERLPYIFDLYGQIDAKNSGTTRSTGLGLTFCKMVIEAHGGQIDVESVLHEGSSFYFTIPTGSPRTNDEQGTCLERIPTPKYLPIELTEKDFDIIEPFLARLRALKVYQASAIRKTLREIESEHVTIVDWKEAVLKAAITGNTESYLELVNLKKDKKLELGTPNLN